MYLYVCTLAHVWAMAIHQKIDTDHEFVKDNYYLFSILLTTFSTTYLVMRMIGFLSTPTETKKCNLTCIRSNEGNRFISISVGAESWFFNVKEHRTGKYWCYFTVINKTGLVNNSNSNNQVHTYSHLTCRFYELLVFLQTKTKTKSIFHEVVCSIEHGVLGEAIDWFSCTNFELFYDQLFLLGLLLVF